MRSILDGVALGAVHQVEVHDPTVVESDCCLEQEVCVTVGHVLVQMHVMDWAKAQRGGPSTECSIRLAEGPEEDRSKSSSGRTHLQQGRPNDLMELTEICDSPGSLISVLNAQGQDQRFTTICSS